MINANPLRCLKKGSDKSVKSTVRPVFVRSFFGLGKPRTINNKDDVLPAISVPPKHYSVFSQAAPDSRIRSPDQSLRQIDDNNNKDFNALNNRQGERCCENDDKFFRLLYAEWIIN